jgi:hypothetical protein
MIKQKYISKKYKDLKLLSPFVIDISNLLEEVCNKNFSHNMK